MDARINSALSSVSDFFRRNKKLTVSYSVLFVLGLVVGIIAAVNANGGEFESIPKSEIVFGSVKVFFFSALILGAGYGVIIVSASSKNLTFLSVFCFLAEGIFFGRYVCILVGCYGGTGIINLIFVYVPFFIAAFCCLLVAAVCAVRQAGACACTGGVKAYVICTLKCFAVNIVINFVIFLVIGSVTRVIVVGF